MCIMRGTCWLGALSTLVISGLAFGGDAPQVVRAVRAVAPPVIDGKLDDACWQQAQAVSDFRLYENGAPASLRTSGCVCFDDARLYVGLRCEMEVGRSPKGSAKPHDAYIFQDDLVEIMLDPGRTQTDFVHLCVNAFGATYDETRSSGGKESDREWNGDWVAKAYRGQGFYSVEVAIPYCNLPVKPGLKGAWGINLARESPNPAELSSIAVGGAFNDAPKFATLEGIDVDLSKFCFQAGVPYYHRLETETLLRMPLQNLTGAKRTVQVAIYPKDVPNGPPTHTSTVTLAHAEQVEIDLGKVEMKPLFAHRTDLYITRSAPVKVVIADAASGETLCVLFPYAPSLCTELIKVAIDDPWQRTPREGNRAGIRMTVHLGPILGQRLLKGSILSITLVNKETGKVMASRTLEGPQPVQKVEFDSENLPWGAYEVRADLREPSGREITATQATATVLPAGAYQIKPLNNLVTELMNAGERGLLGEKEIAFMNPRDGWCFFRAAGDVAMTLDSERDPILKSQKGQAPVEAMRLLPLGRHVLRVSGTPELLIVRAIPALVYNVHETGTQIGGFGIHTWERLGKSVLPNCNVIEGASQKIFPTEMSEWRAAGKFWVANYGIPKVEGQTPLTAEMALQHWQKSLGYTDLHFDGMQIDEYGPSTFSAEGYIALAESMARLGEDPKFRGKWHIPFACSLHQLPSTRLFMKAVMESGWPFSEEWYIAEQATEAKASEVMHRRLVEAAKAWEFAMPGSVRKMIVTLMYSALPYCMTNTRPDVDFKVHLDMQMETLANDPVFFGLFGVQPYRSNYADPDTLRWMWRLVRHYGIEGRTERLSKDPYILAHILNPDFEEGTAHWRIQPAEPDSIRVEKVSLYGSLQGRYSRGGTEGDQFLLTRRSPNAPNAFSQEIKNLTPGRLYCLKMITGDHKNLIEGKAQRAEHAVSIQLDNVELLPSPENSFQSPFMGAWGRVPPPFNNQSGPRFWMNFHWRVFRAKDTTGRLRISDWQSEKDPGGPAGQELMFNFIELQPYAAE